MGKAMDGNGLRERRPKEPSKDQHGETQSHSEESMDEKTYGRTPDGTGKPASCKFF